MEDIEAIWRDELESFFVPKERIQAHFASANEHLAGKKTHLAAHTKAVGASSGRNAQGVSTLPE